MRTLAGQIASKGGEIIRGARAVSLIMRNDCCAGVRVDSGGQQLDIAARAVVIADGGFQGNAELFRQHIGPEPGSVLQRGAGNGMGDGMRMAQEAGAALVGLDRFYGHILCRDAFSNERLWPYPQIDLVAAAAIVVGADGRRFLDESLGGTLSPTPWQHWTTRCLQRPSSTPPSGNAPAKRRRFRRTRCWRKPAGPFFAATRSLGWRRRRDCPLALSNKR